MSNHNKVQLSQQQLLEQANQSIKTGVGKNVKHDSAGIQVTGEAIYVDDRLEYPNQLHVYVRMSDVAHANITTYRALVTDLQ